MQQLAGASGPSAICTLPPGPGLPQAAEQLRHLPLELEILPGHADRRLADQTTTDNGLLAALSGYLAYRPRAGDRRRRTRRHG